MPIFNKAKTLGIYKYSSKKLHEKGRLINFLGIFGVSENHKDPIVINSAEELIDMFDY